MVKGQGGEEGRNPIRLKPSPSFQDQFFESLERAFLNTDEFLYIRKKAYRELKEIFNEKK